MSPPDTVPSDGPRLLGDVGGTHARFAWQDRAGAAITRVRVYPSADFPSLQDGVRHYLADMAQPVPPQAAIGIANPVHGDQVQMTNHHWSFSIQALQQALGLQRLVVVNDFVALALAVPTLAHGEWQPLAGAAQPGEGAPIALIGPGTGLGVAGLLPQQGRWTAVPSEGGHATLSPETEREWQVVQWLQARHGGHASIERAVSGPGLVNLYQALRTLDGVDRPDGPPAAPPPSPADVTERARDGSDPHAAEAVAMFLALLGGAAGNLALTLGATGGVYLGGGILPRLGAEWVRASTLAERFAAKGRLHGLLAPIPLRLITLQDSPALRGVAQAL